MNIRDYLSKDLILMDLESRGRESLFHEMADHLEKQGYLEDAEEAVRMLMKRERLSSSGMEGGFAIPHAYMDQVARSILMVGVSKAGVDFQTLDHEPVFVVFLLLGPPAHKTDHIRLLARISRVLRRENSIEELLAADSPIEIMNLICE